MEYVKLGRTGPKVSRICLGCMSFGDQFPWMLDGQAANRIIKRALDLGITFFDTADVNPTANRRRFSARRWQVEGMTS